MHDVGSIAEEYIPLTPEGTWAGRLNVPRDATRGQDRVYVRCIASDADGNRELLFEYQERDVFLVTD